MTATTETGIEWGYWRVSSAGQDPTRQRHALAEYGLPAHRVLGDKATGKNMDRPDWQKLEPLLGPGDVLVLTELDRLGRTQAEMLTLFTELTARGVHMNVIGGPIPFDTRKPGSQMARAVLTFMAEVELIYKRERVESARAAGKVIHRPRKLTAGTEDAVAEQFCDGVPVPELVERFKVSRATVYRIVRERNLKQSARCRPAPTGRGKSLTVGQADLARKLREQGMSVRKIADAIGSSRATVHRALTAAEAA